MMACQLRSFMASKAWVGALSRREAPLLLCHDHHTRRTDADTSSSSAHLSLSKRNLSSYERQRASTSTTPPTTSVRKRMVPLIKLVHPDLFAQYPPTVASTNSKSLKDLNTLIDAAEALEAQEGGGSTKASSKGAGSSVSPHTVNPFYTLTFFHHKPEPSQQQVEEENDDDETQHSNGHRSNRNRNGGKSSSRGGSNPWPSPFSTKDSKNKFTNGSRCGSGSSSSGEQNHRQQPEGKEEMDDLDDNRSLVELRAELSFPQALSSDPAGSLRVQLRKQLDSLLRRVPGFGVEGEDATQQGDKADDRELYGDMAMQDGVRVNEGETEESFYGTSFSGMFRGGRRTGAPPRHGIRTERASEFNSESGTTSEELRRKTIEHAGDNHHENPWDSGAGSGFLGGGLGRGLGDTTSQARSRRVDDLLRSGRVQFAGVPVSREATALKRLHQVLVKNFDHLDLNDRGLWSTVILVLKAKSDSYEVQAHSGGPIIVIPEKFTEKNLMLFLGKVLLSCS